MKNVLLNTLTLVSTLFFAQNTTNYKVTKVEVYLSGAKVYTESKLNLSQGENTILVDQITNSWLPNTLQANVNGNTNLISITPKTNYLTQAQFSDKEKSLYEQSNSLDVSIRSLQIEKSTLEETIALINSNNKIGNAEQGWNPTQVQQLAEYYSKKVLELKKQIFSLDLQLKKLNDEKNSISQQLAVESRNKNKNQQQLELIIDAKQAGICTVELSYFVNNCGWKPNYDIKAQGKDKPIEIVYKGSVWQTTGVDWNDVEISLKSNQPNQNQNRPILEPNFLSYQMVFANVVKGLDGSVSGIGMNAVAEVQYERAKLAKEKEYDKAYDEEDAAAEPIAYVNTSDVNVSYDVKGFHDVISDGTQKTLLVDSKEVNAKYAYHTVPKLDERVFLLAYIKDWNNLNLMNAEANVYFQNNFIGKIQIDPTFYGEEYPLSFGSDARITVKRLKNKDLSTVKWHNSNKKEEFAYDITLRNNTNTNSDIEVEVIDQIPLSQQESLEIELLEKGTAEFFKEKGFLTWNVSVKKGSSQKVSFKYELKYPKDKVLQFQD